MNDLSLCFEGTHTTCQRRVEWLLLRMHARLRRYADSLAAPGRRQAKRLRDEASLSASSEDDEDDAEGDEEEEEEEEEEHTSSSESESDDDDEDEEC